jgi:hypothetical protein
MLSVFIVNIRSMCLPGLEYPDVAKWFDTPPPVEMAPWSAENALPLPGPTIIGLGIASHGNALHLLSWWDASIGGR